VRAVRVVATSVPPCRAMSKGCVETDGRNCIVHNYIAHDANDTEPTDDRERARPRRRRAPDTRPAAFRRTVDLDRLRRRGDYVDRANHGRPRSRRTGYPSDVFVEVGHRDRACGSRVCRQSMASPNARSSLSR
jgi:hypothetical protein